MTIEQIEQAALYAACANLVANKMGIISAELSYWRSGKTRVQMTEEAFESIPCEAIRKEHSDDRDQLVKLYNGVEYFCLAKKLDCRNCPYREVSTNE